MTSTAVRDMFISSVRKYAADGLSSQPLGDWYETTDGSVEGFRARPVVGGHLALVRLSSMPSYERGLICCFDVVGFAKD